MDKFFSKELFYLNLERFDRWWEKVSFSICLIVISGNTFCISFINNRFEGACPTSIPYLTLQIIFFSSLLTQFLTIFFLQKIVGEKRHIFTDAEDIEKVSVEKVNKAGEKWGQVVSIFSHFSEYSFFIGVFILGIFYFFNI